MIINKIIRQPWDLQLSIPRSIEPHPQKLRDRRNETIPIPHNTSHTKEAWIF